MALLQSVGYKPNQLEFLGQGTYNTVFKGPHLKIPRMEVALKVASGPEDMIIDEKTSAIEMKKLHPADWESYEKYFNAFAKALCGGNAKVDPKLVKRAKYYRKYINTPELVAEFDYEQVRKILENNIVTKAHVNKLWPNGDRSQVAYILVSPLAQGDIWDTFKKNLDSLEDFKKRMKIIRKTASGVLKALVTLHAKGRLHLDIKPDNILQAINEKGKTVAQLTDFGLMDVATTPNNDTVQEFGRVNKEGRVYSESYPSPKGSPSSSNSANVRWKVTGWYKAPEQTKQEMLDRKQLPKIDIYALGATLLIMYLAAKGNSDNATYWAGVTGGVQPLVKLVPQFKQYVDRYPMTVTSPEIRQAEKNLLGLIYWMTLENPKDRPTANHALRHPFLTTKIPD